MTLKSWSNIDHSLSKTTILSARCGDLAPPVPEVKTNSFPSLVHTLSSPSLEKVIHFAPWVPVIHVGG